MRHPIEIPFAVVVVAALLACDPPVTTTPDAGHDTPAPDAGPGTATDAGGNDNVDGGAPPPTWYGDVEPLVQRNCQGCHAEGGIAPFALFDYATALENAEDMASAVESRVMPPWMPSDDCSELRDARRLSDDEIATVVDWVAAGAPEGDVADHVDPTATPGLSRVDLELEMPEAFLPNDTGRDDDYRCFLLETGLAEDRFITGIDILPGQRSIVHHVLLFPADASEAAALDAEDAETGWRCFGGPRTSSPRTLGAWAPGSPPSDYPDGTGVRLVAGEVVVMQVHYNFATAPAALDRTRALFRLEEQVANEANMFPVPHDSFEIPAGAMGYSDSLTLDLSLLPAVAPNARIHGVLPHMHNLGRRIRFTTEDDNPLCLVDIPAWDFHWQQAYFFSEPGGYPIGGGDLKLECTWDNPTNAAVSWGEGTADEMCLVYIYITGIPQAVLDGL